MHLQTSTLWSILLFVACIAAALRLVTFRRGPSRHRHFYAWLSWVYVVIFTGCAVKIACGVRPPPGPVEAIACLVFAVLLSRHGGNLAHLHRHLNRVTADLFRRSSR